MQSFLNKCVKRLERLNELKPKHTLSPGSTSGLGWSSLGLRQMLWQLLT